MKTRDKVIWIAVVAVVLIGAYFLGRWMKEPVMISQQQEIDSLRNVHKADSLEYAWKLRGYDSTYHRQNAVIVTKNRQIIVLRNSLVRERERLQSLPATETVAHFSFNTGDSSYVAVIVRDTMCISPMPSIRTANILIAERNVYKREIRYQTAKIEVYKDAIDTKDSELTLVRNRVIKLTDEYYKSQQIIDRQTKFLEKYRKKVRRRNVCIGILGGLAVGGIAVAVLL